MQLYKILYFIRLINSLTQNICSWITALGKPAYNLSQQLRIEAAAPYTVIPSPHILYGTVWAETNSFRFRYLFKHGFRGVTFEIRATIKERSEFNNSTFQYRRWSKFQLYLLCFFEWFCNSGWISFPIYPNLFSLIWN